MKKSNKKLVLCILLACIVILSLFIIKSINSLPIPDKIIVYKLGETKEFTAKDKEFSKILSLTNSRIIKSRLSTAQDIINDSTINNYKISSFAVEFIYNKEHAMNFGGEGFQSLKYNRLFFELSDDMYNTCFQYSNKKHYIQCSRGPIGSPDKLLNFVRTLFKEK